MAGDAGRHRTTAQSRLDLPIDHLLSTDEQIWSLHPPFDLLTTFSLPQSVVPTTLAVDPTERFFYIGTSTGDIYHVPLFRHRAMLGASSGVGGSIEAIGGGGQGSASIKTSPSVISTK